MQEEVTNKTVALIVDGAKLTEQTFEKAVKKFLEEVQKSKQPKIYRGKQTLKQLAGQNAGLANIEISDKNIRAFTQVAKKAEHRTIDREKVKVNRHLAEIGTIAPGGELGHLLVNEAFFFLRDIKLHLDIPFSVRHARLRSS